MLCRIHGILDLLESHRAELDLGHGLHYEVLLSAYTAQQLAGLTGQPVSFHTLHFLESTSQGNLFIPRLAGFLTQADRRFFELFTTVKGIGMRKALACLTLSTEQLAAAIADRDVKRVQCLPGVGKRLAETIIAALHGKVNRFLDEPAGDATCSASASGAALSASPARQALEVLLQLGESRAQASAWIDQVLIAQPDLDDPQQILTEALRLKSSL